MGRGVWQATVHGVTELDTTEQLSNLVPKKNPSCVSYPQKGQGSSSYMNSGIFLVVCIHSKGDDDAIIDSHLVHSDFIAT